MNQSIFNKIWIHADGTVTTELNDLYKNLIGPIEKEIIKTNTKSASAETDADSIDELLKSGSKFFEQGLNNELLVEYKRLELLTSCLQSRRSSQLS